jgi:enoyl-CoA hydratase/carnithine racemase
MSQPTKAELNALDITPAEAAGINAIAHPLLTDPAPDANDDLVRIDSTADGVVFITINRPDRRNAFDAPTIAALYEAFETLQGADHVRVVFIRGAGGTFSAGADLKDAERRPDASVAERIHRQRSGPKMCAAWEQMEQVTIAAIEGFAIGGGAALAVSLDFRFCGRGAHFRIPEVELGMNMSWGSIPRMVALMGPARTTQAVILASDRIPAETAVAWGLGEEVVDDGAALEAAMAFASRIAEQPPLPVRMSKTTVNKVAFALADSVSHMDPDQNVLSALTEDYAEGTTAFREKRKPRFTGR